jgi:hypothetical protein
MSTAEYAKLKKEVWFHEKRLHLLLTSRVVEDLPYIIKEKQDARWGCFNECRQALDVLVKNAASEAKLSGRWNETRIASMFGLELPLLVVVGSEKFEVPSTKADDVSAVLEEVHKLSKRYSEFAPAPQSAAAGDDKRDDFLKELHHIQWTPKDMEKMKTAITSKLAVLTELNELSTSLRNTQFQVSSEEMKLEELRRHEERAVDEGEMALSDAAIRERMSVLKRIMDLLFFQAHTIDSSVDSNIMKKRSNLALFQEGTAALAYIRGEKERVVETCRSDIGKIGRGLEYDNKTRGDSRSLTMLQESHEHLRELDQRQKVLSDHLERIANEFNEVEQAITDLGNQRMQAMKDHMDILESRRQLNSDANEKLLFAEQYRANLEHTKAENEKSSKALLGLEKLLLRQCTFDDYDFEATAKRLRAMQRRVAVEMNRTLNEYETAGAELVRRLTAQLKVVAESADLNEVAAEVSRETLDPITKKYVARAREFQTKRDVIAEDCRLLREVVESERAAILRKVEQHLDPSEIVDNAEATQLLSAARAEELLDFRQELLTPPDVRILDERLRVMREYQTSTTQAAARSSIRKASASSSVTGRVRAIREEAARRTSDAQLSIDGDDEMMTSAADDELSLNATVGRAPDVSGIDASSAAEVDLSSVSLGFTKHNEDKAMQYRQKAPRTIGLSNSGLD